MMVNIIMASLKRLADKYCGQVGEDIGLQKGN